MRPFLFEYMRYLDDTYRDALEDFHERRELQGLGDSDGLGSDPTLEPPSLAPPVFVELVDRRHKRGCDVWNVSPPWDCTYDEEATRDALWAVVDPALANPAAEEGE